MPSQIATPKSETVSAKSRSSSKLDTELQSPLEELLELVADETNFDLKQAAELARQASLADYRFESSILVAAKTSGLTANEVIRLIRILEVICPKPRLLSNLLGLRAADPRVRSKVTLTVGRLVQNAAWLREQLSDPDPRVRADAVEALWTARVEGIENLLAVAARDTNNRVASNAACALYKLGVASAIPTLTALLNHRDPKFRCSGIWAIAHVGDPRFLSRLRDDRGFSVDAEEQELRHVTIEQLEECLAAGRLSDTISLKVHSVSAHSRRGRTLQCSCAPSDAIVPLTSADLSAVNFDLVEDGEPIDSYEFRWLVEEQELASVLLLPHGLGVRDDVISKHPSIKLEETLSIARYRSVSHNKVRKDTPATARVQQSVQTIPAFSQAFASSIETLKAAPGHKHLFVVVDSRAVFTLSTQLRKAIRSAGVIVHAVLVDGVSEQTVAIFRKLCGETGGSFSEGGLGWTIVQQIQRVRAAYGSIIEIGWESKSDEFKSLTLKCFSPIGCGETTYLQSQTP